MNNHIWHPMAILIRWRVREGPTGWWSNNNARCERPWKFRFLHVSRLSNGIKRNNKESLPNWWAAPPWLIHLKIAAIINKFVYLYVCNFLRFVAAAVCLCFWLHSRTRSFVLSLSLSLFRASCISDVRVYGCRDVNKCKNNTKIREIFEKFQQQSDRIPMPLIIHVPNFHCNNNNSSEKKELNRNRNNSER